MKYTFKGKVRFSEIDHTKRMTLPGIINYLQDVTIFQSESLNLGVDYFAEHGRAWMLSAWQIVVDRYPSMGEEIETSTWATGFRGLYGYRNFSIKDEQGRRNVYANSVWVYMDVKRGRPVRPRQDEIEAYDAQEALPMEFEPRKIELPHNRYEKPCFTVGRYQIDTNEHMNNCQYVQMALEAMDRELLVGQVRVEYKKSAVYRDRIVPWVAEEGNRTVISLCDEQGIPYAVVELKEKEK